MAKSSLPLNEYARRSSGQPLSVFEDYPNLAR